MRLQGETRLAAPPVPEGKQVFSLHLDFKTWKAKGKYCQKSLYCAGDDCVWCQDFPKELQRLGGGSFWKWEDLLLQQTLSCQSVEEASRVGRGGEEVEPTSTSSPS